MIDWMGDGSDLSYPYRIRGRYLHIWSTNIRTALVDEAKPGMN